MKYQIKSNNEEANKAAALNSIINSIINSDLSEEEKADCIKKVTEYANSQK